MKLPRNAKIFRGQLDAAPFAGVLFLLLIFLLLNSKMIYRPGVRIELPEMTDSVPGTSDASVVVAIDQSGQLFYESQLVGDDELIKKLKVALARSSEPLTLEILADKAGKVEPWAKLANRVRSIGFKAIDIRVRPPVLPIPAGQSEPK